MERSENSFLAFGEARVNVGALAIGDRARAVNKVISDKLTEPDQVEVAHRLAELIEQLQLHADQLPNGAELVSATQTVVDELAKEQPNRLTVMSVLRGLAADTQGVVGVTAAVQAVVEAVSGMLG